MILYILSLQLHKNDNWPLTTIVLCRLEYQFTSSSPRGCIM